MNYELKDMSGITTNIVLMELLNQLSNIDVDDMTTFELTFLHRFASNPPSKRRGVEDQINNGAYHRE